jgi:hypothetical protein
MLVLKEIQNYEYCCCFCISKTYRDEYMNIQWRIPNVQLKQNKRLSYQRSIVKQLENMELQNTTEWLSDYCQNNILFWFWFRF